MSDCEYAIEVRKLTKIYVNGVRALDELEFSVVSGTIFALLGPSWCREVYCDQDTHNACTAGFRGMHGSRASMFCVIRSVIGYVALRQHVPRLPRDEQQLIVIVEGTELACQDTSSPPLHPKSHSRFSVIVEP